MQSLKEILAELGFNPDAPMDSQTAFVKHLLKAANEITPKVQHSKVEDSKTAPKKLDQGPEQLEFTFSDSKRVS